MSVVVPVHDTLPYLGACLDSLVAQTLNEEEPGALEVLAIDDGSTDGSGELLDEYAGKHDIFRVEHHPASGGPATPRNRALDLARGRWVFFLDADDYLWEEALLRLVRAAEEWDSDVVFGRMVGAGGRGVFQGIYRSTEPDIDLTHRDLPYTLSVTKLFRRSLIEEHGLRFDPGLRIGSDQPFAVAALAHARRISVLADHPYYYAVMREDLSNITYSVPWRPRLEHLSEMIHQVAGALPEGERRENVLSRHFSWELTSLLNRSWAGLERSEKAELVDGVAAMADAYLTSGVAGRMTSRRRVVQRLAQHRRVDLLDTLFGMEQQGEHPPVVLGSGEAFLAWPGFGELPDEWYALDGEPVAERLRKAVDVDELGWEGTTLRVAGRARVRDAGGGAAAVLVPVSRRQLRATGVVRTKPAKPAVTAPLELAPDGDGSRFVARVDTVPLLRADAAPRHRWELRVRLWLGEHTVDVAVTDLPGGKAGTRARLGLRFFRLLVRRSGQGRVVLHRHRLPLRQAVAEKLRG